MKKAICMIALAAFTFSTVYSAPVKTIQQDTTKVKVKKSKVKVKSENGKVKKKMKDTTMKM